MTDVPSTSGPNGSSRSSGSSGTRGNPAPRRALARVRPLDADDGPAQSGSAAAAPDADRDRTSPAAAPGGTEGRDLLIPGRHAGRGHQEGGARHGRSGAKSGGKGAAPVPSLAELMPPPAPSGRRTPGVAPKETDRRPGAAGETGKGKTVELVVTVPKALRKRLKARASELGLTPEEAVAQLVEVWVDG